MGIFRIPGQMYDYVYNGFGWFGVAFAGLGVVLGVVFVMIWFDRRK